MDHTFKKEKCSVCEKLLESSCEQPVDLELSPEETGYLEEPYVPHPLAGVMAQNKPAAAKEKHVWSTGDQKIGK